MDTASIALWCEATLIRLALIPSAQLGGSLVMCISADEMSERAVLPKPLLSGPRVDRSARHY